MISMVVPSGSEHEKFTSYFRVARKLLYDDLKQHDKTTPQDKTKLSDNDCATVTDKLNMGFGSLVHVKGGPRSFSSTSASSSSSSSSSCSNCQEFLLINNITNDEGRVSNRRRESESYVAVKGQSLIVTKREGQKRGLSRRPSAVTLSGSPPKSINACESPEGNSDPSIMDNLCSVETQTMTDIERHLHQMTQLLRPEDSIKLIVRLESSFTSRLRYLAVVSCMEQEIEEFCLLGIDCQGTISLGLVLAILSHTVIRLDGDGGFCITYGDGYRSHIFKPVSVQTMWSALQSLYRASECAKQNNSYQVSAVKYYDTLFQANKSDMGCLNEWNVLPGVEQKRPLVANMSSDELSFQETISSALREILLCERDLDEVTSKEIRTKLEHKLQVDLSNYKPFIDEEMLKILGQMEAPAMILENLYLGTEWNASHQQELCDKDIGYILNVTAEIDNFFPDTFRYMNIPVSDNEETDLLRYFNDSYRFINEAHKEGKNVLVHCKMGISRSATIVIAYVMKNRNWDLLQSLQHVKVRRMCVKPNPNFMKQLEVYEGILTAKRFSDTLEKRSKSESNLKQSDFTLASPKDTNAKSSSSNECLNHSKTVKKSPKKYYNTAPARLKPEKHIASDPRSFTSLSKAKSSLSRPKSCSCAAIPVCKERDKLYKDDSFVQRDVLDSFQDVVKSLEQSKPSYILKPKFDLSKQVNERSSLPDMTDCWMGPLPLVTVSPESSNFISKETVVFSNTASQCELSEEPRTEPALVTKTEQHEDVENCSNAFPTNLLNVPNTPDSTVASSDEVDKPSSDQVGTRKATPLKCCRRPFNGHTFSVSPNQVVNISSGDFSKFSVRHLVNEFESHSSRNSLNNQNTNDIPPPGILTSSAISDSSPVFKRNTTGRKSRDAQSSDSGDEQNLNCSLLSEPQTLETAETEVVPAPTMPVEEPVLKETPLIEPVELESDDILEEKEASIGCLPFLKGHSSTSSKIDRSAKEAASNTIVKLIKSHQSKKSSDNCRSREKFRDRGNRSRSKMLPLKDRTESSFIDPNIDNVADIRSASTGIFQKTGVVKQRLEAFEAKSVPTLEQYNSRSHNRSHSATGSPSSTINMFCKDPSVDRFSIGHRRKSSMPHLNSNALIHESSQSNPSINLTTTSLFNRKGSLDSNTLFRSIPNMSSRSFTVRGFQSPSSQTLSSKFPFSSTRHHRNAFGFNTASSGTRQQHGSTHPLKLLPQTTKLSQ